ncbi:MAG: CotH kinase family protein [Prevotella sp.]
MRKYLLLTLLALCTSSLYAEDVSIDDLYPPTNNRDVKIEATNLPVVFVNTLGGVIQREDRITARMKIVDNGTEGLNHGDTIAYPDQKVDYEGYIGLKYRGNSSFEKSDKKPYGFKTLEQPLEEGGKKQKVSLLGMGKDNDWVLLAPFADKSMIRDVLTFELARPYFGYTPYSRFCELILNGVYYGVYILMERPGKGKYRLNLNDPGEDDGDLTGDFHVEKDRDDEEIYYTSPYRPKNILGFDDYTRKIVYQYDSPDPDDLKEMPDEVRQSIDNAIYEMETSFTKSNYTDPLEGYRKYINTMSFVDYFLTTEFTLNIDGYRLSTHMYKYSETRARKEGLDHRWQTTLWDFNIAYGNDSFYGDKVNIWQYDYNRRNVTSPNVIPFWWDKLLADPAFISDVRQRWTEYRHGSYTDDNIETVIDRLATELTSHGAADRNEEAWKTYGQRIWPSYTTITGFDEEISNLKSWVKRRARFLDDKFLNATGIEENTAADRPDPSDAVRYTVTGCRADKVQKGLVIVRYPDGRVRKMISR